MINVRCIEGMGKFEKGKTYKIKRCTLKGYFEDKDCYIIDEETVLTSEMFYKHFEDVVEEYIVYMTLQDENNVLLLHEYDLATSKKERGIKVVEFITKGVEYLNEKLENSLNLERCQEYDKFFSVSIEGYDLTVDTKKVYRGIK